MSDLFSDAEVTLYQCHKHLLSVKATCAFTF